MTGHHRGSATEPTAEVFDAEYFDRLAAAAMHWWVRGMQAIAWSLLDERRTGLLVLDAGCGTGANLFDLARIAAPNKVYGLDRAAAAIRSCRALGAPSHLLRASVTDLPFRTSRFDLVVSIDVLQHLDRAQEAAALSEVCRVLRPGGRFLVRTNSKFGRKHVQERDDWRLYDAKALEAALTRAGLTVEAITGANMVQSIWASLPRRRRATDHVQPEDGRTNHPEWGTAGLGIPGGAPSARDRVLLWLLRLEARWVSGGRRRVPLGHSLVATARRV